MNPHVLSIISRAASPAERAQAGAFRAVAEQSLLESREEQAIKLGYGGDQELFLRTLDFRGIERDTYRAGLVEVEVDSQCAEQLPAWARTLLEWSVGEDSAQQGLWEPFLARARHCLASLPASTTRLEPAARADLLEALQRRLQFASSAVLASTFSELDASLDPARTVGHTVEEVFLSNATVSLGDWLEVYNAFPVLGRLMALLFHNWCRGVTGFLERLDNDWDELAGLFFAGKCPQALTNVRAPAGADFHGGGQQVLLLTFQTGSRLVYKPRNLRLGAAFLELQAEIERLSGLTSHRRLMLTRDEYTWDQFLLPQECTGEPQVKAFYHHLGVLARLTELLNSRDLHRDNLLAVGEFPVVIDLETLVQPYLPIEDNPGELVWSSLLTSPFFGDAGMRALDFGILAGHRDQPAPYHSSTARLTPVPCLAFVGDSVPEPTDYFEEIESGYAALDQALLAHGPQLEQGVRALAGLEFRYIYRKTDHYVRLLLASLQPGMLRDGLRRNAFFEQLYRASLRWGHGAALAASEIEALGNLDVPVVLGRVGEETLLCENGQRVDGFFRSDLVELLTARLTKKDPLEQRARRRNLRSVLASIRRNLAPPQSPTLCGGRPAQVAVDWLGESLKIGEMMLAATQRRPWVCLGYVPWADCWMQAKACAELLGGTGGWAVVFGELGQATGDARYSSAAKAMIEEVRSELVRLPDKLAKLRRSPKENFFCGSYHGLGGQFYALLRCAQLLNRPDLRIFALDGLESLPPQLCLERAPHGWVLGLAGLVPALREGERDRPAVGLFLGKLLEALEQLPTRRPDPLPAPSSTLLSLPHGEEAIAYALARGRGQAYVCPPSESCEPLELLENALENENWATAEAAAQSILSTRVDTGTWFPAWGVSDEHHLCALTGLGAISLAFLRLAKAARVPSLRRLEFPRSSS